MEKYENIGVVGEGSYGLVMKCRHRETGQLVAIKKFIETEEDLTVRKMALREIRMLKKLRHENLVNMIEVFRRKRRFYLVFEYMDHTILDELEAAEGGLGEEKSREHIFQIIRGIDFCHYNHIIHRDIKPENVLVSSLGVIKLCDFGFARLLSTNGEMYTDYVATRWYRAPELLVGDTKYGKEVDIWAIGCLFAEIMAGDPLFPGDSDIDQLFQIMRVMGRLSAKHQQLISRNPMFRGLKRTCDDGGKPLNKLFPSWSVDALDFVGACLKMDPQLRPSSSELLKHAFITKDNFAELFLPELRQKIIQEFQCNPLLRKYQSAVLSGSAPRRCREISEGGSDDRNLPLRRNSFMEPPRWKINLINAVELVSSDSRRSSVDIMDKKIRSRRKLSEAMDYTTEENENQHCPGSYATYSQQDEGSAREVLIDVQPPSPAPFQSLQTFQGSQTPGRSVAEFYSSTPVQNNLQVLHPSINNLSFGSNGAKRSPLPASTKRDSTFLTKALQNGINANTIPFAPRTQLIRRLDRPPGGIQLDTAVLQNLGEPTTPPPWLSKRGTSRDGTHWKNNKNSMEDFTLPNVPGASGSPTKGAKKKLNGTTVNQTEVFSSPRNNTSRPPSESSRSRFGSNFPFM